MSWIIKKADGTVVATSETVIVVDNERDCFRSQTQAWFDPRPSSGATVERVGGAVATEDVWDWFIDVGPFFDRFGAAKMAILSSSNATVKALVQDLMVRKWIDLKRADVAAGIDALIALNVAGVTAELKASVLTTPVTAFENLALRKLYFS